MRGDDHPAHCSTIRTCCSSSAPPPTGTGHDPRVADRVSEILLAIERGGETALRRYSRDLDGWDPRRSSSPRERSRAPGARRRDLKRHLERSRERTEAFARAQRATLTDLEVEVSPGVIAGHRLIPVGTVGAYLPAGRVPLLASPFMTVLVPKVAGVETVLACAPPLRRRHLPVARLQHRARAAPTGSSRSAACRRWPRWRSGSATRRGRHARRRRQRLRRRGQAPALWQASASTCWPARRRSR